MLLYSKPSQYALRAVSYIVKNGVNGPCQALEVAKSEDIPKPFLSKILKRLVEAKILASNKGPGGGFLLSRDPRYLSLYDIVSVFDDVDGDLKICAIGWANCCDSSPCSLHFEYKKLRESISEYLKSNKIIVFAEASEQKKNDI